MNVIILYRATFRFWKPWRNYIIWTWLFEFLIRTCIYFIKGRADGFDTSIATAETDIDALEVSHYNIWNLYTYLVAVKSFKILLAYRFELNLSYYL